MNTTVFLFVLIGAAYAASRVLAIVDWIERS